MISKNHQLQKVAPFYVNSAQIIKFMHCLRRRMMKNNDKNNQEG